MMAVSKPVLENETFIVSGNAGPSPLAGKGCSPYFFAASYQNDQNHEVMGKYAQDKGYKRVVLMTPNYQAGKDSMAGFKRYFKGEVVEEIFVPLGQLDFSAELAKISAANPDALFTFMPGGMGVNLVSSSSRRGWTARCPSSPPSPWTRPPCRRRRTPLPGCSRARNGHRTSTRPEQGLRGGVREGIWRRALALCGTGL